MEETEEDYIEDLDYHSLTHLSFGLLKHLEAVSDVKEKYNIITVVESLLAIQKKYDLKIYLFDYKNLAGGTKMVFIIEYPSDISGGDTNHLNLLLPGDIRLEKDECYEGCLEVLNRVDVIKSKIREYKLNELL